MEVERKDISSGFKVEISELEEQKAQAEEQVKRLREAVEKLQAELQSSSRSLRGPGWGADQERRAQREQAELEQNYAREISNLVQRLTSEKDQLEAELKLKMDQDLLIVRWVWPDYPPPQGCLLKLKQINFKFTLLCRLTPGFAFNLI